MKLNVFAVYDAPMLDIELSAPRYINALMSNLDCQGVVVFYGSSAAVQLGDTFWFGAVFHWRAQVFSEALTLPVKKISLAFCMYGRSLHFSRFGS